MRGSNGPEDGGAKETQPQSVEPRPLGVTGLISATKCGSKSHCGDQERQHELHEQVAANHHAAEPWPNPIELCVKYVGVEVARTHDDPGRGTTCLFLGDAPIDWKRQRRTREERVAAEHDPPCKPRYYEQNARGAHAREPACVQFTGTPDDE